MQWRRAAHALGHACAVRFPRTLDLCEVGRNEQRHQRVLLAVHGHAKHHRLWAGTGEGVEAGWGPARRGPLTNMAGTVGWPGGERAMRRPWLGSLGITLAGRHPIWRHGGTGIGPGPHARPPAVPAPPTWLMSVAPCSASSSEATSTSLARAQAAPRLHPAASWVHEAARASRTSTPKEQQIWRKRRGKSGGWGCWR